MQSRSHAVRHLVLRLLDAGFSRIQAARLAKVSPASVSRLGRGRARPCPPARPLNPHVVPPDLADPPPEYDPRKVRRCPGCGEQVYVWPCLHCELHGSIQLPAEFKELSN